MLNVAIVGTGGIAHAHANAYKGFDDVEVVAGADIIPGKARDFLDEFSWKNAAAYETPQLIDDFGTEEFTDSRAVAIPAGHSTLYLSNLRAKLEMAPDSPDGDGDYIVRQTGGRNAYVKLTFPADELPAPPEANGTYSLKCTVSNGTVTYRWQS